MNRFDQFIYRYNAWVIVVAAVGYNLSIEHLTDRATPCRRCWCIGAFWGARWWGHWLGGRA